MLFLCPHHWSAAGMSVMLAMLTPWLHCGMLLAFCYMYTWPHDCPVTWSSPIHRLQLCCWCLAAGERTDQSSAYCDRWGSESFPMWMIWETLRQSRAGGLWNSSVLEWRDFTMYGCPLIQHVNQNLEWGTLNTATWSCYLVMSSGDDLRAFEDIPLRIIWLAPDC